MFVLAGLFVQPLCPSPLGGHAKTTAELPSNRSHVIYVMRGETRLNHTLVCWGVRGTGTVTRCPLELQLRRGNVEVAELSYTKPGQPEVRIDNLSYADMRTRCCGRRTMWRASAPRRSSTRRSA